MIGSKKENSIPLATAPGKFGWDALRVLAKEGLASIKHKTVVQPLLWLCGAFSLGCFLIAALIKDAWLQRGLFVVGVCPLVLFFFTYIYFIFKDPDRLHSEEFQLKSRSLSTVESKGGTISILPVDLSTDPFVGSRRLLKGEEGNEDE